ncbi:MAG: adenylate/guanylate cyclase domain-containing protein [Deltaproteobacteria bacterium]|nr:adenylate/guanylate cyclase domain-containing protein [Deltaproteobacteria bacterium]
MAILRTVNNAFWKIANIGVTTDLRPEDKKHILYLNLGALLLCIITLYSFFQVLVYIPSTSVVIPVALISTSVLSLLVYVFQRSGRYTTAGVYFFLLYYAMALVHYPLNGKEVGAHYFLFPVITFAFFVFPVKKKKWMFSVIALGLITYATIIILYACLEPIAQVDPFAIQLHYQINIHGIFATFILMMFTGRNLTEKTENSLMEEREKVAEMTALLKKMFGRYLSTEVMNTIIDDPTALELGGERRSVTIMMTDLRGFTYLAERFEPEQVVEMLNAYFEVMVEVVLKYNGTINEIIGDALLVLFGAPQEMHDRAQRAIACAIEMQNAMAAVNRQNRAQGLPELEMGIGLNESEVVVGNIGSSKRSKYAVVGSGVNMASRIESYTVGGQILISESVRRAVGGILRIDYQREVLPKGAETPLKIFEVGGIGGEYNLTLEGKEPDLATLARSLPLEYAILEGKDVGGEGQGGRIVRLSKNCAEIALNVSFKPMTNLKMNLRGVDAQLSLTDFYGKIVAQSEEDGHHYIVRFTSIPSEIGAYFQAVLQFAVIPKRNGATS